MVVFFAHVILPLTRAQTYMQESEGEREQGERERRAEGFSFVLSALHPHIGTHTRAKEREISGAKEFFLSSLP